MGGKGKACCHPWAGQSPFNCILELSEGAAVLMLKLWELGKERALGGSLLGWVWRVRSHRYGLKEASFS